MALRAQSPADAARLFYFGNTVPDRPILAYVCNANFGPPLVNDGFACNAFGLHGLAVATFYADPWHPWGAAE